MCIYIYIYMHIYIHIYIYIHMIVKSSIPITITVLYPAVTSLLHGLIECHGLRDLVRTDQASKEGLVEPRGPRPTR
jgi:hypothetical protein